MKAEIILIKHLGAYSITLKKEVDLPIPPFFGMTYFDNTNGEEIECKFINNDTSRCDIYIWKGEVKIAIYHRVSPNTDIDRLEKWKKSCMNAKFILMKDESSVIARLLKK